MNQILKKIRMTQTQLQRSSEGKRSPLHIACLYGNVEMCRNIISKFPFMLHETDDEGLHAVHYTAVGGNVKVMKLLVEFLRDKIEDFYISKARKFNILQMACVYGKFKVYVESNPLSYDIFISPSKMKVETRVKAPISAM